jgi:hypothetical protein
VSAAAPLLLWGKGDDLTHLGRLDRPVIRSVLLESELKAVLVVPDLELPKQPPCVTLTRHDTANPATVAAGYLLTADLKEVRGVEQRLPTRSAWAN